MCIPSKKRRHCIEQEPLIVVETLLPLLNALNGSLSGGSKSQFLVAVRLRSRPGAIDDKTVVEVESSGGRREKDSWLIANSLTAQTFHTFSHDTRDLPKSPSVVHVLLVCLSDTE